MKGTMKFAEGNNETATIKKREREIDRTGLCRLSFPLVQLQASSYGFSGGLPSIQLTPDIVCCNCKDNNDNNVLAIKLYNAVERDL